MYVTNWSKTNTFLPPYLNIRKEYEKYCMFVNKSRLSTENTKINRFYDSLFVYNVTNFDSTFRFKH